MSALSSLFNRASFGVRCKTCLNLAISRIKLLRNKREVQLKHMYKEISQYLQTGQEAIARIRVEHIIREQNIMAVYEILELFCEFVLARIPILETQRDCPPELQEAIASVIFASPRCSDLPELMQIRNLFTAKYGKEFVSSASELRPDSSVNRTIIEKLAVRAPPPVVKLNVLKAIAHEFNINWNSSSTEEEFNKKHEDLLDGSNPSNPQETVAKGLTDLSISTDRVPSMPLKENKNIQPPETPHLVNNSAIRTAAPLLDAVEKESVNIQSGAPPAEEKADKSRPSDVLERARAAIAAAERASAAARAAAELVNVKMARQISNVRHSS